MRQVYLDHQTTTSVRPEVFEAMKPYFSETFGSPSSLHQHGLRARDALAQARVHIAQLINAESPDEIIFTSGGTESANLAVKGAAYASERKGNHIVLSAVEHPAVMNSVAFLEKQGFACTRVRVDSHGCINPEEVSTAITDKTILVCVHHVNHDIGTIEPIRAISRIAAERGIAFFADATASGGWLPIDVQALGVNLLSLSPHRFYGPKGVGVLYRNRRARLAGLVQGGMQESGRRAGTENMPAIVGAGVAAELASRELPRRMVHTRELQRRLWDGLSGAVPHLHLNGPELGPGRITTNLNLSAESVEGEGLTLLCDLQGIAMASGTICGSQSLKISHVLSAIGLDPGLAQAAVILSLGMENTGAEIDYVIASLGQAVAKLRGMSSSWVEFQRGRPGPAALPTKGRSPAAGKAKVVSGKRAR